MATVGDVAARVAEAFSVLPNDPRRSVRRWAARLGVSAQLAGVKLSLSPSAVRPPADEARAALLELLDVPLGLHEQDGGLTVVCLDEFQDLLVADDSLDGLFRSVIQHHGGAAAYVFAGSQPSLMRALFSDRERPFYGQARPLELPVLPADEAARDVESLLAADGLQAGRRRRRAARVHRRAPAAHRPARPPSLQRARLAHPPEDPAAAAVDLALAETRDAHQAVWDGLGRVERIVLIALADGQAPTGSRMAAEHRVARSTLQDALERLVADERNVARGDEHAARPARICSTRSWANGSGAAELPSPRCRAHRR